MFLEFYVTQKLFILLYQCLQCSWDSTVCFNETIRLRTSIVIGLNLLIINQLIFTPDKSFQFQRNEKAWFWGEGRPLLFTPSVILPKVCQQNRLLSHWRHVYIFYILQRLWALTAIPSSFLFDSIDTSGLTAFVFGSKIISL